MGILKTMHDEMTADAAAEKATEEAAIKAYDALMAAKTKEVNALTKAIEEKMTRVGELAVEIVQMKNDLGEPSLDPHPCEPHHPISREMFRLDRHFT